MSEKIFPPKAVLDGKKNKFQCLSENADQDWNNYDAVGRKISHTLILHYFQRKEKEPLVKLSDIPYRHHFAAWCIMQRIHPGKHFILDSLHKMQSGKYDNLECLTGCRRN
jgi:hypothetical protein